MGLKRLDEHINQRFLLEKEQQNAFASMIAEALTQEPEETLIKYGEEKCIAVKDGRGVFHAKYHKDEDDIKPLFEATSVYRDVNKRRDSKLDCSIKGLTNPELRAIMNRVFPPIVWREDDKIFRRNVSLHPANRSEVGRLQDKLDELISGADMKETGICDGRRKIFDQCFDELARQELVTCLPRGLLLLRIRDEIRMTLKAYESLYLSNAAYGVRKAVQIETEDHRLLEECEKLIAERKVLLENIRVSRISLQDQSQAHNHAIAQAKRFFVDERDHLRRQIQNLKNQLESMVSGNMELAQKQ